MTLKENSSHEDSHGLVANFSSPIDVYNSIMRYVHPNLGLAAHQPTKSARSSRLNCCFERDRQNLQIGRHHNFAIIQSVCAAAHAMNT
mmetsp:Transcript_10838/g.22930  ORF Transcript_10838/g.22930 Transcript_10838/m.22930 type:complete len:88 (+) Transcript_10838:54-317(+)